MADDTPDTEDENDEAAVGGTAFLYPGRPGVSIEEARRVYALEFADAAGVAMEKIIASAALVEGYLRDGSVPVEPWSASRLKSAK